MDGSETQSTALEGRRNVRRIVACMCADVWWCGEGKNITKLMLVLSV